MMHRCTPQMDALLQRRGMCRCIMCVRDVRSERSVRSVNLSGAGSHESAGDESESDDSVSSDEVSDCVSGGGSSGSDGESTGSVCDVAPTTPAPADVPKKHWNTPQGWANVRTGIDEFMKTMGNHGHTCAICGERSRKTVLVEKERIFYWNFVTERSELEDVLYTQYPKTTHDYNVRFLSAFFALSTAASPVPRVLPLCGGRREALC